MSQILPVWKVKHLSLLIVVNIYLQTGHTAEWSSKSWMVTMVAWFSYGLGKNGGGWQGPVDRRHDKIVTDSFIPTSMILKVQMLNFERGLPAGHDCTGLGHNCCS